MRLLIRLINGLAGGVVGAMLAYGWVILFKPETTVDLAMEAMAYSGAIGAAAAAIIWPVREES